MSHVSERFCRPEGGGAAAAIPDFGPAEGVAVAPSPTGCIVLDKGTIILGKFVHFL